MAGAACCSPPCREAAGAMCAPDASARAVLCLRASTVLAHDVQTSSAHALKLTPLSNAIPYCNVRGRRSLKGM